MDDKRKTELIFAARSGDHQATRYLLSNGIEPDEIFKKKTTMTNYERILRPSIEELAKQRTECISYSCGYTYKNDAGIFRPEEFGGDPRDKAIKAEIEWLNSESDC